MIYMLYENEFIRRTEMEQAKLERLCEAARQIRIGVIEGTHAAKSGHPGGSLSIADIMAYLYFEEMNIDPANPKMADRDRFVLSKGHCAPALYAALAHRGFFSVEELTTLRKIGARLQGHPDMTLTPGVDMSAGSLGLGISSAAGMALAGKLDGKDYRVYTAVGDGESEEGQVWEACMFAAHYKLDNLCAVIDYNGLQIDGPVADVIGPAPFESKFEAFGWNVISIDAHNFDEIEAAFAAAKKCKGKPTVIIAKSVKGKGVSYMENKCEWHGSAPKTEQYEIAVKELTEALNSI